MSDESSVPMIDRYLDVEGIVSPEVLPLVRSGLPVESGLNTICCFVSFANDDVPVGTEFQRIFYRTDPAHAVQARCKIYAVTQQYGKPFAAIPQGWKTITVFEFPDGIPDLIKNLPVVREWYATKQEDTVLISNEETWALISRATYEQNRLWGAS